MVCILMHVRVYNVERTAQSGLDDTKRIYESTYIHISQMIIL